MGFIVLLKLKLFAWHMIFVHYCSVFFSRTMCKHVGLYFAILFPSCLASSILNIFTMTSIGSQFLAELVSCSFCFWAIGHPGVFQAM